MGKIKQLPPEVAQQVAAGEVIERPANIVKELIENALDAKATMITVWIEDGGKKSIRIKDNGFGMSFEDAKLCFSSHATSKITTVADLETVASYGFRGEALASIASVAKVTLKTKEAKQSEGYFVSIEGGIEKKTGVTACSIGTDIFIEDLFYQIPARKKFLKKTTTEIRHIQHLFYANCLQFLHVHFSLISEGRTIYNCPPVETVFDRWIQLHGYEQQNTILRLKKHSYQNIEIDGIISNHQVAKYDRSYIYLFVNRRWIKNQLLVRALLRGYNTVLRPNKYPMAVINITIDSLEVDSNIHPRKEEVKFLHPRRVEQQLQKAVKVTLEKDISQKIAQPVASNPLMKYTFEKETVQEFDFDTFFTAKKQVVLEHIHTVEGNKEQLEKNHTAEHKEIKTSIKQHQNQLMHNTSTMMQQQHNTYQFIGNYNKTYILAEHKNSLVLIDQHAAHERVLYEQFAHRFEDIAIVTLLFPQMISGKKSDFDILEPHLDILKKNGFTVERFDQNNVVITATPVHAKNIVLEELLQETISWIKEYNALPMEQLYKKIHHNLRAQMACKGAVKAGDVLTKEQMITLLSDLSLSKNCLTCPHGRPTLWSLDLYEIEKKFKRRL